MVRGHAELRQAIPVEPSSTNKPLNLRVGEQGHPAPEEPPTNLRDPSHQLDRNCANGSQNREE